MALLLCTGLCEQCCLARISQVPKIPATDDSIPHDTATSRVCSGPSQPSHLCKPSSGIIRSLDRTGAGEEISDLTRIHYPIMFVSNINLERSPYLHPPRQRHDATSHRRLDHSVLTIVKTAFYSKSTKRRRTIWADICDRSGSPSGHCRVAPSLTTAIRRNDVC